jgi:hypothetical protein
MTNIALAALVGLILLVAFITGRALAKARGGAPVPPPADCAIYPRQDEPLLNALCQGGVQACSALDTPQDVQACKGAVGACMPVAQAALSAPGALGAGGGSPRAAFNRVAPLIPACAKAAQNISPEGAARAYVSTAQKMGIKNPGLPPREAPYFQDAETSGNIQALANLAPDNTRWMLAFGKNLPVKK